MSTADGSPIFYLLSKPDRGAPAPVALALADGIGCDGYVWKYLRRDAGSRYPIVHLHYRGHGRSPPPRDPARVTIADLADDLACVLDDAGLDRAVLLGHSMGVQVVLETYRRHRDRVAGLVLLCGAPSTPLRTFKGRDTLERALPAVRAAVSRMPRIARRLVRTLVPTRLSLEIARRVEVNDQLLDESDFLPYLRGLSRVDPSLFLDMLASANEHSATDLLPAIDVPVLIVAGDRDGFTPPELSREMADAIPGSELLVIEDGSHTAPIERPDEVNGAIAEFLARRVIAGHSATG